MSTESQDGETFDHVSVIEYNEAAEEYGKPPGERVILSDVRRDTHVRDESTGEFVKVGEAVAIIELHTPLTDDEITEWCNTPAGKLALAHWFDHYDPEEVVMT